MPVQTLAATVITEILARTGISGADIDDVILGQGSPNADAPAFGRVAALDAGLGIEAPGQQIDRRCGSGLPASLAREMVRREARYGLETMCIGGGQGLAALFERV